MTTYERHKERVPTLHSQNTEEKEITRQRLVEDMNSQAKMKFSCFFFPPSFGSFCYLSFVFGLVLLGPISAKGKVGLVERRAAGHTQIKRLCACMGTPKKQNVSLKKGDFEY